MTDFTRPQTFIAGQEYFMRSTSQPEKKPAFVPVKFVDYDVCPAIVVVRTETGTLRCLRDDLFMSR